VEKYLDRVRHIEFQIVADGFGDTIHLGERDCTIQRRYQKIIEESPAFGISDESAVRWGMPPSVLHDRSGTRISDG